MREPSASKLALAEHCGHPWTSGARWPASEQSDAAAFGTRTHLGCEGLTTGEACYPAAYAGLNEAEVRRLDGCVASAWRYLVESRAGEPDPYAEIDLRYDVASGVGRRGQADEPRRPGEWTGKADLVLVSRTAVHVVDWKTGQQDGTQPAATNPQMRFYALAAARWAGVRHARVSLVYLDERSYHVDTAELGPLDLALAALELRDLRKRLTQGPTPPVPGPWCTQQFCPLVGQCPATQAALASAYPLEQPLVPLIRDDEHARYTLERVPAAYKALEAIERAVREYARTRPVPMGNGKVYAWRKTSRRDVRVETSAQLEALRGVLGAAMSKAVVTTTSIEAIKQAAQELAGGPGARGQGAIVARALEALEAVGGVVTKEFEKPEIFKPKENTTT